MPAEDSETMPRCEACWSTVETLRGDCPHCGEPLARAGTLARRLLVILGTAAGVTALAFGGIWLWSNLPAADPTATTATDRAPGARPVPEPAGPGAPPDIADREGPPPGGVVALGDGLAAAVLQGPRGDRLLVRATDLLDHPATPMLDGLRVVHHAPEHDLLLLARAGDGEPAPTAVAIPARSALGLAPGTRLWATVPGDGQGYVAVQLVGPVPDGRLQLTGAAAPGAVLRVGDGAVVALADSPGLARPVDPILGWLGQPPGPTLTDRRPELRAAHPALLVADGRDLLDRGGAASEAELLDLLRRILARAPAPRPGDPELEAVLALESLVRLRLAARIQDRSPQEALALVVEGLDRHPDDAALAEVAADFEAAYGDPDTAAQRHATVRILDAERARRIASACADNLAVRASRVEAAERPRWLGAAERIDPTPERVLALAQALAAAGRTEEAARAAARAPGLAAARELLARLRAVDQPGTVRLPIPPNGTVRAVAAVGGQRVRFVVDTGASMTTIPTSTARALGLSNPSNPRVQVTTASGTATGEQIRLPSLRIGDIELRNIEAIALDLPGTMQGEGLLGMSALNRLRVTVDGEAGEMVLQAR